MGSGGQKAGKRLEMGPLWVIGVEFSGFRWESVGICGCPLEKRRKRGGKAAGHGAPVGNRWRMCRIPLGVGGNFAGTLWGDGGKAAGFQLGVGGDLRDSCGASVERWRDIGWEAAGKRREMGTPWESGGGEVGKRWELGIVWGSVG